MLPEECDLLGSGHGRHDQMKYAAALGWHHEHKSVEGRLAPVSLLAIASLLPGLEEKFWLLSEGLGWGLARRGWRVAGSVWLGFRCWRRCSMVCGLGWT
ncbi:hypothetical protein TIFTF001_017498 [Ficus carica]|uniref:Uncharacterized protein n=1 Tax=Ficus carica TaxID=3494 RepID=A0AA88AAS5_FICCA|nr:hypothetical protein TIFTF001_017498 [Ficus carica]